MWGAKARGRLNFDCIESFGQRQNVLNAYLREKLKLTFNAKKLALLFQFFGLKNGSFTTYSSRVLCPGSKQISRFHCENLAKFKTQSEFWRFLILANFENTIWENFFTRQILEFFFKNDNFVIFL